MKKDREIKCYVVFTNEVAYSIDDALFLLKNTCKRVVLGGDIYTGSTSERLMPESSNWSFSSFDNKNKEENIQDSIHCAVEYLEKLKVSVGKAVAEELYVVIVEA